MKKCSKCKIEKSFEEFSKHPKTKTGLRSACKECDKLYRINNSQRIKKYEKKYRESHKEINKQYNKKYQWKNREEINEYKRKYYEKNKIRITEKTKKWANENKDKRKLYSKNYENNRKKIDPLYKLSKNIRTLLYNSFKRGKNQFSKNAKTESILGCTIEEFRLYIQSQFKKGMTFENHGDWHLDHIIPLANATTEEEIIKLNHYTNFQPLWAKENISKGDKIIEKQLKLL